MSDEAVIVREQGTIFLGGPPLVKAATGEVVTAEELGGGELHSNVSGVTDHLADDDAHALRDRPRHRRHHPAPAGTAVGGPSTPWSRRSTPAELYGVVPADERTPYDVREVIARRSTAAASTSSRPATAPPSCGFARIWGHPVGIVANNGVLFSESALKGAHFIQLCDQRRSRWCSCRTSPGSWSGASTRPAASPSTAPRWSPPSRAPGCRSSPSSSAGRTAPGNYSMCGRSYSPRFLWMWPNARISVMGGEQAASVLATVRRDQIEGAGREWSADDEEAFKAPIREQYEHQGHPYYASARLWDDGVIDPADTRTVLGLALEVAGQAPLPPIERYGVFRM
jgi:3-methylcrotonyl-CoA carboxylase beta subunit